MLQAKRTIGRRRYISEKGHSTSFTYETYWREMENIRFSAGLPLFPRENSGGHAQL